MQSFEIETGAPNPLVKPRRAMIAKLEFLFARNDVDSGLDEFISKLGKMIAEELRIGGDHEVGDIWTGITSAHDFPTMAIDQPAVVNALFNEMFSSPITHGFDQGHIVADALRNTEASRAHIANVTLDTLVSLAEALGVIPIENFEQGAPLSSYDPDELLNGIQSAVDFDISAPPFYGGMFGMNTRFGLHTQRSLTAIYIAHYIREFLPHVRTVCEIGGGSGMQAFYLNRGGFNDLTIVDLPTVGMAQAYFLSRNAIDINLHLNQPLSGEGVSIITPRIFLEELNHEWDLLLNVDSFPEMPFEVVRTYLQKAGDIAKFILSINQEAAASNGNDVQLRVPIVAGQLNRLNRIQRSPFWLRSGYVLEIYRLQNRGQKTQVS